MRISDWCSDVCSSDLEDERREDEEAVRSQQAERPAAKAGEICFAQSHEEVVLAAKRHTPFTLRQSAAMMKERPCGRPPASLWLCRSEEHTSELQSLMRISYAVFCLKKKKNIHKKKLALTRH